jgi:LruC domain-containing protein
MREIILLFLSVVLIGGNLFLTGCEVDYYQEPEPTEGSGSSLFGDDVSVPAGFDWSTTRSVDVSVQVDDQYNGSYYYTVELFDANPLFDENANLVGKGVAKKNSNFTARVALPTAVETLYVQQTNPTGGKTIAAIDAVSPSLDYRFTTVTATTRSATAGENELVGESYSTRAVADQYTLPSAYTRITQTDGTLSLDLSKGPYLIDGNFSGTFDLWGTGDLYINGTVEISGGFQIPSNSKLIVLEGGSVKTNGTGGLIVSNNAVFYNNGNIRLEGQDGILKGNAATIINDGILYAQKDVEITGDAGSFFNHGSMEVVGEVKSSNRGKYLNAGSMEAQSLTLDNGVFENNGIAFIKGHTQATNNNVILTNNNNFTTNTMYVSSSATVRNNCHLVVENNLELTEAKLFIGDGGLLTTANLSMNNTRVELGSASMMHVTTLATYNYNLGGGGHGFYGTGSNKALLKIAKAVPESNSYPIIHYQGNLEIESYDHPNENVDASNKRWTQEGVTWAGEGGSSLVIPGTECNDGGNNATPVGAPQNPVFPIIYTGSSLTYMFEDNWPYLGDYDMNDVVLDMKPTYTLDAQNKVTTLKLALELRAVGATKRLAVGLQLDGIAKGEVANVTRSSTRGINGNVFSQESGLETGQTYAVIPVFDDAHQALGLSSPKIVNTTAGLFNDVTSVDLAIHFVSPLNVSSVTVDKFNLFLVNGGYSAKRQEIHMAGFQPTDKADKSKFGHADDNSTATTPYVSKNNMIWGLAIPGPAKYPKEWTSISNAYTYLQGWATSAGLDNKDWYKYPDEGKIFGN